MAYAPIALTIPQYEDYPNYWLKAYVQGTTTPLSMATDSAGGTTLVKCLIDAQGFPKTSSSGARFIPFINGDYDLWLFPTEGEADGNITVNAIQVADNLNADPGSDADTLRTDLASIVTDDGTKGFHLVKIPLTANEDALSIVPIAYEYPEGDSNRYCVGDGALNENGTGTGTGTDDSTAIQNMFDLVRDYGVVLEFDGSKVYLNDTPFTLLSTASAPPSYTANFNGCAFDQSNITGSTIGFRLGATSQANAHEKSFIRINGSPIFAGPESANPASTQTSTTATRTIADTTTKGLSIEYALNCVLEPIHFRRYYQGWETFNTWPFRTDVLLARECYIGGIVKGNTTRALMSMPECVECHYGIVLAPATDEIISNLVIDTPRFENVGVPISIDPGAFDTLNRVAIENLEIRTPYFEACPYDHFRVGVVFDDTVAGRHLRGADRDRYIWNPVVTPGKWSRSYTWATGSGKSPAYFAATAEIVIGGYFAAPAEESECINIPMSMDFQQLPDSYTSATATPMLKRLAGDGHVVFDGAGSGVGIALDLSHGNVSSVDETATGSYSLHVKQAYVDFNEIKFEAHGWNAIGFLQNTTTASRIDFIMRNQSGTAVDVDKVRITIGGRLQ